MRIETVRQWFDDYVDGFHEPGGLPRLLELKRTHTLRVASNTRKIAAALGWPAEDIDLAEAVGLLHDIGRFPQYTDHGTFSDARSVDHGDLGSDIIARELPWADIEPNAREAILLAVKHHNDRSIPDHVPAHALPLLRVLRDGDKLDVFLVVREWTESGKIHQLFPTLAPDGPLHPIILRCVAEKRSAPYEMVQTLLDYHLIQLSWVYDLNYAPSFRELVSTGLLEWTLSRLSREKEAAPLLDAAREHVRAAMGRSGSPRSA
jgi:putative nucleotidyltransferase with HDIG domain